VELVSPVILTIFENAFADTLQKLKTEISSKIDLKRACEDEGYEYSPPPEQWLFDQGIIEPLSLEISAESDDELSTLEEHMPQGRRFSLLRELWNNVSAKE